MHSDVVRVSPWKTHVHRPGVVEILVERTGMNSPDGSHGSPRRLLLVRHGPTAENVAGRFLGRTDAPVTEAARVEAAALRPLVPFADLVVTSPARRAVETAELLGLRAPLVEPAFREIDFGDWEGLTQDEVAERDPTRFAAFEAGDIEGFPGGETVAAVAQRTVDAVERHRSSTVLVVTHATVIRILVAALLDLPVSRYRSHHPRPTNLSVTSLERQHGLWRLESYASTMHGSDR